MKQSRWSGRPISEKRRQVGEPQAVRVGMKKEMHRDIYHAIQSLSWPALLLGAASLWLLSVFIFALLYTVDPQCVAGELWGSDNHLLRNFFFSVQTLSTIGYGGMSPANLYGNILVTIEALIGLLMTAVLTGLVFAKFSSPTARFLFARHPLITQFDGERVFMFRLANQRASQVYEASLRLSMLQNYTTAEGGFMRRFCDLELKRPNTPVFSLGWTVFHVIDDSSPLYGMDAKDLADLDVRFILIVTGVDSTLATRVHARHSYQHTDVRFGFRYVDIMERTSTDELQINYNNFHELVSIDSSLLD